MATEKEGMVNGSSSTSRVSSNFALARTAPLVHCTPCRRFYFLQIEIEVSIRWPHPADTRTKLSRIRFSLPSALTWLEHGGGGRMEAALRDGAAAFCKMTSAFGI